MKKSELSAAIAVCEDALEEMVDEVAESVRDKDLCNCDQALTYKRQRDRLLIASKAIIASHTPELSGTLAFAKLIVAVRTAGDGS